jgi:hypothetical protein
MIKQIGVKEKVEEKAPLLEKGVYINDKKEFYLNGIATVWVNRSKQVAIYTDLNDGEIFILNTETFIEQFKRK